MNTVQTNVRVLPGDKPLVRAIAARLRIEPRFRDRLKSLIEEDPTPALQERIEQLEEKVGWLMSAAEQPRAPLRTSHLAPARLPPGGSPAEVSAAQRKFSENPKIASGGGGGA
jgi:hypothetical protein